MNSLSLIGLYYYICKVYDTELCVHCQRQSNNSTPVFSDQELLTCYLFAIMEEQKSQIKSAWSYIQKYWLEWFPTLPSYQTFSYRLNRMASVFPYLVQCELNELDREGVVSNVSIVDSMPIIMCSQRRRPKVAPELADAGYCATKRMHYYGVKLHIMGFWRPGQLPFPEWIQISKASWHDLAAIKPNLTQVYGRNILGDKIYQAKHFQDQLQKENQTQVITPIKRKSNESQWERQFNYAAEQLFNTAVSKIRQSIEALFSWLIQKVDLQNASKVRSTKGLIVHTFGKIAAAYAFVLFNS